MTTHFSFGLGKKEEKKTNKKSSSFFSRFLFFPTKEKERERERHEVRVCSGPRDRRADDLLREMAAPNTGEGLATTTRSNNNALVVGGFERGEQERRCGRHRNDV